MPHLDKAQAIVQHILRHVASPRRVPPGLNIAPATKPLIVGISGPQGIGKTTITNKLVSTLTGAPHNLRVFTFSMDDLYLPFKKQVELSQQHPNNKLIEFRGLPGTHDMDLGADTFRSLCLVNQRLALTSEGEKQHDDGMNFVAVPSYDKALNAGRGDQVPQSQWTRVEGPFDVVLFEGWSLGFESIRDPKALEAAYYKHTPFPPFYLAQHSLASVEMVNRSLEAYEAAWYSYLDIFVHLSAPNLEAVFKWRAEQEQELWAARGTGMTEEQVKEFVSRFMPAYELYLERLKTENIFKDAGGLSAGRHLRLDLDEDRELLSTTLVE
ncbi:D-glycerate 3-kinase [Entomortierella parvispora]|uniref:D-glycerate 3-kinase n=1 Tax=Entomortierella parvispora TaxID=205924 RepID=A0A9P3LZI6_9FUNG|nr:D-glycerate 3-kinase [Entomortierella parvispora]